MSKSDKLIACQNERHKNIQKALANYDKTPKTRFSVSYLETRLEGLEKAWTTFVAAHDEIVGCLDGTVLEDIPYFKQNTYFDCEENYINYKSDLKSKLAEFTVQQSALQQTQQPSLHKTELKLPSINIPTFSGRYIDWPSFHDIFETLIHKNTRLDDVQKLHYLKTNLSGEAELLLRNIHITSQNYTQAWETLKRRYNNKRYIANSIFNNLFAIKKIISESHQSIKHLLDTTTEGLGSLNNLGLPTASWDAVMVYLTVSKLDNESQRLWEQHIASESYDLPTLAELLKFLENRFRSLEIMDCSSKPNKPKSFHAAIEDVTEQKMKCSYCNADHYIYQCKQFAKKDCDEKYSFAKTNNLCFNCLIPKHSAYQCKRNTRCKVCQKKHHSLLHPDKKNSSEFKPKLCEETKHADSLKAVSHFSNNPGQVLLATALVDITTSCGQTQVYRALIDQGSQSSFVSEDFAQTTGLKRIKNNSEFHLSEGKTIQSKFTVEFEMKSRCNPTFTLWIRAYIINHITTYLPQKYITVSNWPELDTLTLADPDFNKPGRIDMLLGASVTSRIMGHGMFRSPVGTLAQKSQLGWIISGDTNTLIENNRIISMHSCVCENNMLKQFWELENELLPSERKKTKEEKKCEEIYSTTTVKTEAGRYKVKLPFKEDVGSPVEKCGKTKEIATARFLQLERRFQHNLELKVDYTRVLQEYLQLGHMKLVDENKENGIYLPHHAVVREDKDTTRVRVVFDASCQGTEGCSLNNTLLTGPILQDDLRTLLMKWRKHKIVLISDIVKMYRQVLVADDHAAYQQIIWRDNPEQPLNTYRLLTVTFGTACAPYLAVRTLVQVAEDEGHKYPIAAQLVKNSFYMDDFMSGCQSVPEALEIYRQMTELLHCGGFELQKWSSNSNEVLDAIAKNQTHQQGFEIKFDQVFKILGLTWDRQLDQFKFKVNIPEIASVVTKRTILSEVARLFDPFGWLAPVIILAKIMIQKLWLCNAGWNDQLSDDLVEEWLTFRGKLQCLEHIHINRWINTQPYNTHLEIHGFADASTVAYAAVLYVRVVNEEGVTVTLLGSKTKVAPLKQVSVPRLELCAAVLLARLLVEASKVLEIPKANVYAYTDSMVVLAWIQAQPIQWQTFVANRVAEIQEGLDNDRWSHVKSELNPADLASRGVDPSELKSAMLWWQGPEWLRQRIIEQNKPHLPQTELEKKKQRQRVFCCNTQENMWERFSSLNRMIRVLSYCRRFLRLRETMKNIKEQPIYLTTQELRETLHKLIKLDQTKHFQEEIEDLNNSKQIKQRSKLKTLSPYLEQGFLRVGGRLQAAKVSHEIKHPIILPKDSHLTKLIIRDAHLRLLHGGNLLTINYMRSRYWVIGLKPQVKKIINDCVTCTKHRGNTAQPRMGDLPLDRSKPGKPFQTSGVDYAGPIQVRTSKGRGYKSYKGYICLFVCFSTKAIHMEAVSDLSSQAFIASFRRFVARRGHCTNLWSDNGTNFVGAAKELSILFKQGQGSLQPEIAEMLANDGTAWHFIPPRAPNFGGLWEAGIKSAKTHMMKVIGNSTLTFEEITTLLTQIEACLNSRPICELNNHPDDVNALTPSHFLIGEPLVAIPDTPQSNLPLSPLNRWKLVQRMTAHFWRRWSTEYLHTLQQRHKWQNSTRAPEIGEVVLVKEAALPPTKWLMAVVVGIHPGSDGEIRVVSLKTKTGLLKRPVSKLVALLKH